MYKLASLFLTILLVLASVIPSLVGGQVRSSTNYKIARDAFSVGGGLGTSTSYSLQDTVGDIATGDATSTSYQVRAGYQQALVAEYISISSPSDINLDAINGLVGGVSTSSASWTVTTNSNAGYTIAAKAGATPALTSALDSFLDYVPVGSDPDYVWSIDADEAAFGYSVLGDHTVQRFKDNGAACNISIGNVTERCWDGFSTSDETLAQSASANDPSGTVTTLELRAEIGTNRLLTAGDYSATITVTALGL